MLSNNRKKALGFSVLELMVTVGITGITLALGLPAMKSAINQQRVDSGILSLSKDLTFARSYAINNQKTITLCPMENDICGNDWSNGYTIFLDRNSDGAFDTENDIKLSVNDNYQHGDLIHSTGDTSIQFSLNGQANRGSATLIYCPEHSKEAARGVSLNSMGRARASKDYDGDGYDDNQELLMCTSSSS